VAEAILALDYDGVMIRDGWSPYDQFVNAHRQQCLNHLLRRADEMAATATRGAVCFPRRVAELLQAGLDQLARASEAVRTLETVPGVGPRTAEAVAACVHDPHRFRSGKQVSAYAGLVPRQFQSGACDRGGRITRRGPALLRKLLVECAWVMLRYNAWAGAVYLRLSRGQARKKQAIVALAPRLAFGAWFIRRGRNWDALPNPLPPFGFPQDGRLRTVAWQRTAANNHAADDGQADGPRPEARAACSFLRTSQDWRRTLWTLRIRIAAVWGRPFAAWAGPPNPK
jgi:hypothetical protein